MKKIIITIVAIIMAISLVSCKSEQPVETPKSAGEEIIITETVIEETIIVENIETEKIVSEEYLSEMEFNSQKNSW